jgi:hypothetical protein
MDIRTGAPYPASALSNFARHSFTIDGVECSSMESGFNAQSSVATPATALVAWGCDEAAQ